MNILSGYEIQRICGRHLFGRRLVKRYENHVATDEVHEVQMGDIWNGRRLNELQEEMGIMWEDVIQHINDQGVLPSDLIRIHISHRDLKNGGIKIPLQQMHELTPEATMERISKVMQSYENLMMDDVVEISVGIIRLPRGQARHQHLSLSNDSLKKNNSLVVVDNTDTYCVFRGSLFYVEGGMSTKRVCYLENSGEDCTILVSQYKEKKLRS
jgi:hypothetical protein